jgi:hypothetical protein
VIAMRGGKNVHELALLDQAGQALAEARSLDAIKEIRDKAEAVRKYAESASLGLDVQNRAAEVKLRAERQAGKLLAQLMLRGGDRRSKGHRDRLKLDDLGLTSNQSKRWQLQARVPENLFRAHVEETCEAGKELTSAGLMRLAKRLNGGADQSGESCRRNGRTVNRFDVHSASVIHSRDGYDNRPPDDAYGGLVSELSNHHKLLDGILQPVYSGETTALRPAELRMLRYLMAETGALLVQLQGLTPESMPCCHTARAAI